MNDNKLIKSPIFYMGNKFDILHDILVQFPKEQEVDIFIDLFGGSGTISLNVPYKHVVYNELNDNTFSLFKMLKDYSGEEIINHVREREREFELPKETTDLRFVDKEKRDMENEHYLSFRKFYNQQEEKNILDLYTITFYSFCNIVRFNTKGEFNMPFGNRCFLPDIHGTQIKEACQRIKSKNIGMTNVDAFEVLEHILTVDDGSVRRFIYLDPPYSNSVAIYNEKRAECGWNIDCDLKLFEYLDKLTQIGVKWCMSNVLEIKGKKNNHLEEWIKQKGYTLIHLSDKTYSTCGTGNSNADEIIILNYEQRFKMFDIYDFM